MFGSKHHTVLVLFTIAVILSLSSIYFKRAVFSRDSPSSVELEQDSLHENRDSLLDNPSSVELEQDSLHENRDSLLDPLPVEWVQKQFARAYTLMKVENPDLSDQATWNNWTIVRGAHFYYFAKINTVFLGIPKTGCTHWLEVLMRAEGILNEPLEGSKAESLHWELSEDIRVVERNVGGWDMDQMSRALTFTVLRNPWVRLVSAFRAKLSDEDRTGVQQPDTARKIVSVVRGITQDEAEAAHLHPTFEEFVQYLLFWEKGYNPHWNRQWTSLKLDKVKYDFVIPLELTGTMSPIVLDMLDSDVEILGSYDAASDPRLGTSAKRAREWFSNMNQTLVEMLYEKYKIDFVLLNYSNFTHPHFPLPLTNN